MIAPVAPSKQKRALLPFLLATPVLFGAGAAMAYYIAIPTALKFLLVVADLLLDLLHFRRKHAHPLHADHGTDRVVE